jgi:hypothetical protein
LLIEDQRRKEGHADSLDDHAYDIQLLPDQDARRNRRGRRSHGESARPPRKAVIVQAAPVLLAHQSAACRMPPTASELGQLRARHRDPHPARTEIDDQRGVIIDSDDPAEAVLVVCHLVLLRELLGRRSGGRGTEGTCGQEAPGGGAVRFHHYQYVPGARYYRNW